MAVNSKPRTDVQPIAVTFAVAKKLTGLGLTTLWKLAGQHRIETIHIGRRTLITYRSLEELLAPPEPMPASAPLAQQN